MTVKNQSKKLLQRPQLQQLLSIQLLRLSLQLCKVDLHLDFQKGWNPMTAYGMPPDFFTTPPKTQFNTSATQPMTSQPDPSATQPMGSQQDASATPPNAHGTWSP